MFFAASVNAQNDGDVNQKERRNEKTQKDRPLKITSKAPLSEDVYKECLNGSRNTRIMIRLKVTFESSGKIGDITVSNASGCEYFDNGAIRVAKKIKFKPAIKDGKPVTVTRTVEYAAGIY
jgi:TonB family protein